ncbi:hypothetical protein ABWH88_15585 [Marinobacter adhaerens]|uniref:hypothetical protein n=1 Tax=Marinobacter adhaerens TaxID=1033846 RepID=UPI0006748B4E|nr:hypothetical protein [Marinobacter adhaerens]MBW4978838.1 hypothetical protein [Marinobacter adhaerens]
MPNPERPKGYWEAYGGWKALFTSPYLWSSVFLSFVFFPLWREEKWIEYSQGIFPDLLGFTLGGFAIFVAFGDKKFLSVISGSTKDEASPLVEISASFAHFIFCQVLALLYSVLYESTPELLNSSITLCFSICEPYPDIKFIFSYIGSFFTIYALTLSVAAVIAIFRLVAIYDIFSPPSNDG